MYYFYIIFYLIVYVTIEVIIHQATSDIIFKAQIDRTQRIFAAENGKPIYYYHVSFYTNKSLNHILYNNNFQGKW